MTRVMSYGFRITKQSAPVSKERPFPNRRLKQRRSSASVPYGATGRPPLQLPLKPRGFFRLACFDFRTPAKFFQEPIRFAFDCIGDEFTQHRCEFKPVPAIAGCDNQSGTLRIGSDSEIPLMRIAVQT